MTITKKPDSNQLLSDSKQITIDQKAFISGAKEEVIRPKQRAHPVMLRPNAEMLERIDLAAKKRGLKRAPFILSAAVQLAERILEK